MKTRVPFDRDYVTLLGHAVYLFSYYEWAIVYITEQLQPGFLAEYCREHWRGMTSGQVSNRFMNAVEISTADGGVEKGELECCWLTFDALVQKRNALIHAHPVTDVDGAQILNCQASPKKQISDMKWETAALEQFIQELDVAAVQATTVFDRL